MKTQIKNSIENEILHCKKMIESLKDTDKTDLLHRFIERLSELQHWLKIENQ